MLKSATLLFTLIITSVFMSGCVSDSSKGAASTTNKGAGGTLNRVSTSNMTPASFAEDVQSIITLDYVDLDSNLATSCTVNTVTNANVTQACSCSSGVCTVGITGSTNFNGTASFRFFVVAGGNTSTTSTATLTITPVADPPTVSNIALTDIVYEDIESGFLTLNYNDPDGDKAGSTDCSITNPSNITISTACTCDSTLGNCKLKVTSAANYNGSATFDYSIRTNGVWSNTATASLVITNTDDAPVSNAITPVAFNEDTQSLITLSYSDIDNDKATSCTITAPVNVTVTQACACDAAGVCKVGVTGTSNYFGSASFSYTVKSLLLTSNVSTATLTINSVDDAPITSNITPVAFNEDLQSVITLAYSDPENDLATNCSLNTLTNVSVTQACSCSAGVCTVGVTGTANYYGAASFKFTVGYGALVSNASTANLTINPIDDAPSVINATLVDLVYEDLESGYLTLNYTDIEGDRAGTSDCLISSPSNLTISTACTCDLILGNCKVKVTGIANYFGTASFNYSIRTNSLWSNTATASLAIIPVDDAPVAIAITPAAFNEDTQSIITLSYTDLESDKAILCTISSPTNVTVTQACACNGAGVCTVGVTGTSNYNGAASFSYTVKSLLLTSNSAIANLTINPVDDAPVATNITPAAFNEDVQSLITLAYSDVENDLATTCTVNTLSNVTITQACSCTAGVCKVGVTGTLNYNGAASFMYSVTANTLTSNFATASLTISPINDAPTITALTAQYIPMNQVTVVNVLINDVDGALNCSMVMSTTSSNTSLIPVANVVFGGTYPNCTATITPVTAQTGVSNLTFTVNDGALTAASTFALTVRPAVAKTWKLGDVGDTDTYALSSASIAKTAAGVMYLVPTATNQTHASITDFAGLPATLSWNAGTTVVKRNETVTFPYTENYLSPVFDGLKSTTWNSLTYKEALPSFKGLPDSAAIALLSLDEASGPLIEKYNSLSFTATGAPTYNVAGKINKSITFSGTSQYFQTPFSAYMNPTNQFSVCSWVKPAIVNGVYRSFLTSRDTNKGYAFYVNTKFEFWIGNGTSFTNIVGTSTPSTAAWSLVCGSYDGTTASLSVNGVVETSVVTAFTPNTVMPTRVAAGKTETTAAEFFNGSIDDIIVFNRTLTSTELTALNGVTLKVAQQNGGTLANQMFNNELTTDYAQLASSTLLSSLVGLWHFDETGASSSVRNGATSLLEPVSGGLTLGSAGKLSYAASFDGTATYLASTLPYATNVNTNSFSFATWFRTSSAATTSRILSFSAANSPIGVVLGKLQFRYGSVNTSGLTTVTDGLWHHVVVTGSGTTCRVYLDGNITTPEISPACATATPMGTAINLGRSLAGTEYYTGLLDESALWSRALSTTEIAQLYRRGINKISFDQRSCALADCSDGVFSGTPKSEINNTDSLGNIYNTPQKINFTVSANRYLQYKAIFYSELATNGPELKQVSVGPTHYSYPTTDEYFSTQNALSFKSLSLLTETLGTNGCSSSVRYQFSKDQINWKYFDGTSWLTGTSYATASTLAQVNAGVSTYTSVLPGTSDTVYVRGFLKSAGANECELDQLLLNGNN